MKKLGKRLPLSLAPNATMNKIYQKRLCCEKARINRDYGLNINPHKSVMLRL
jgi:hypothetical protein